MMPDLAPTISTGWPAITKPYGSWKDGTRRDFTYANLRDETSRFANVLKGSAPGGDPVVVPAGRIPELYIAALGTLKNASVFTPLFSAFGPELIQPRINIARAKVLVTTDALYRRKVEALRASIPTLEHAASEMTVTQTQLDSASALTR